MKRFVGSFVHVILTRQTCGQHSSRAAESKRRALGNYFSERICHMFLISKCRGDWDLGVCTSSVLALREPQCNGKIRFFLRQNTFFFGFWRDNPSEKITQTLCTSKAILDFHFLEIASLLGLLNCHWQNRQDRACRIELADLGLNFPFVKSILPPA